MRLNLIKDYPHPVKALLPEGFVTPRLSVRPLKPGDPREMGAGFEAPSVWRFSRGIDSMDAAVTWLARIPKDPSKAAFSVRLRQSLALAGFCVLSRWDETRLELGGWSSSLLWNRGLGSEFLHEMKRRMTDETGRCPLVAEVDPANVAAVRLLQGAGFVPALEGESPGGCVFRWMEAAG